MERLPDDILSRIARRAGVDAIHFAATCTSARGSVGRRARALLRCQARARAMPVTCIVAGCCEDALGSCVALGAWGAFATESPYCCLHFVMLYYDRIRWGELQTRRAHEFVIRDGVLLRPRAIEHARAPCVSPTSVTARLARPDASAA